jgi:hypothetical protein
MSKARVLLEVLGCLGLICATIHICAQVALAFAEGK